MLIVYIWVLQYTVYLGAPPFPGWWEQWSATQSHQHQYITSPPPNTSQHPRKKVTKMLRKKNFITIIINNFWKIVQSAERIDPPCPRVVQYGDPCRWWLVYPDTSSSKSWTTWWMSCGDRDLLPPSFAQIFLLYHVRFRILYCTVLYLLSIM